MVSRPRPDLLLAGFVLLSLLLHLLLLLLPGGLLRPAERPETPLYVEVRPSQQRDRELDLPPRPAPPRPRDTPAKRLAPQDQMVKREQAPAGRDGEERRPRIVIPTERPARSLPAPRPAKSAVPAETPPLTRPEATSGDLPVEAPPPASRPAPSLKELTTLSPGQLARLERDWRSKLREGVEKGDTVWLDTEQDLLISFFRRFRTNIYNVWNYPDGARRRGEQGQCLLRIIIGRQGTVDSVELLESSGSAALDEEALRAVRKGAPYGPLPSAYPHAQLKIMGYFRYSLNQRDIYGERR